MPSSAGTGPTNNPSSGSGKTDPGGAWPILAPSCSFKVRTFYPEYLAATASDAGIAACTRYAFSLLNFGLPMHPAFAELRQFATCDNMPH
jgi:hypothetical protein